MTISKLNQGFLLTIPKDLINKIKKQAKDENRSANNLIVTELKKIFEDKKP